MSIFSAWMQRSAQTVGKRLKFGGYCTLCACPSLTHIDLCAACQSLLKNLRYTDERGNQSQVCAHCGLLFPLGLHRDSYLQNANDADKVSFDNACGGCQRNSGLFVRVIAPFRYEFPLDRMIQQMKYREQRQMSRVLGSLLADAVVRTLAREYLPDVLLPVPMHKRKELDRGFNQAQDIARWCAKDLQLPLEADWVRRIVDTDSLAGLTRAERQYRILGAFQASERVANRRVAIIDDVLTTGSTARELAREIYDTGASSVEVWVLARTSRSRLDE